MGMKALFDTNILIDFLNGIPEAQHEIKLYPKKLISIISWIEVLIGVTPEEEPLVRAFLANFDVLNITQEISELAIGIRKKQKIRLPDAIILGTALFHDALLV